MNGRKIKYYWDTCIYLAWLRQEQTHKGTIPSIEGIIQRARDGKVTIYTSVITIAEVLTEKLPAKQRKDFEGCFRFGEHELYDVDVRIAQKASKIREIALALHNGKKIKTPDAIHIATAQIIGVEQLHTLDNELIALHGSKAVDGLNITKPSLTDDKEPGLFD